VPIPWTADGPSFGFGAGGSWLPQPADWAGLSVEKQLGDPNSVLELYRSALRVRHEHPDLGAGSGVEWLDVPEGLLAFRRGAFTCVVNFGPDVARLPAAGRVLLSSGGFATEDAADDATEDPADDAADDADLLVPPDTTVWLTRP
jgi:alpha-glucosidase